MRYKATHSEVSFSSFFQTTDLTDAKTCGKSGTRQSEWHQRVCVPHKFCPQLLHA